MIDRRRAICRALAAAALPAIGLLPSSARAQQGFQRFIPFFIDLPGWTGKKADGMAMEMPGTSIITANRDYARGGTKLTAQVIIGPAAQGALAATNPAMKFETSEARMSAATVDGFPVAKTFTFKDKSGVIMVALGPSAMFSLAFTGLSDDEALELAKKFDWKAIQAALPK
jgi:hypothetical protein